MAIDENDKVIKVKRFKAGMTSYLTNCFRELVDKELGKLNAPHSFMYLYNRFGAPSTDNNFDFKFLYDYWFKYDDVYFTINACSTLVLFSLLVNENIVREYTNRNWEYAQELGRRANDSGVAYTNGFISYKVFKRAADNKRNWKLVNKEARENLSKSDCEFFGRNYESLTRDEKKHWDDLYFFLGKILLDKFHGTLTKDERDRLKSFAFPKLSSFPKIEKTCHEIIDEMKEPTYVRDIYFNIKGFV